MNGSIYNGMSGLLSFQKAIDVESNNIANVSTVGFKSDTVSFSDMMYQDGIGMGVRMNEPIKNFNQGSLKQTGLDYDFAINGEGFFTVTDPQDESVYYTRAGNFRKDANSNLVDVNEMHIMGILPVVSGDKITSEFSKNIGSSIIEDDTTIISLNVFATDYTKSKTLEITDVPVTAPVTAGTTVGNVTVNALEQLSLSDQRNITIDASGVIQLTDEGAALINSGESLPNYSVYVIGTGVSGTDYKSKNSSVGDIEALRTAYQSAILAYEKDITTGTPASVHIDTITYPLTTDASGNYRAEITINGVKYQEDFDTDVETTLKALSDTINRTAGLTTRVDTTTGELTVESMIAGAKVTVSKAQVNSQNLVINPVSQESGSGQNLVDALYAKLQSLIEVNGGAIASVQTEITKTPSGTPPSLGKISLDLDTLGISDNTISSLENDNGDIYLTQNGAKFLVAKLAPVLFQYSSSLRPEGHNLYSATSESGDPLFVAEKAEVINNYVEVSSTDLSEGLVNLMVWQKAFDANSKSVTTSDELLKTALALKTK